MMNGVKRRRVEYIEKQKDRNSTYIKRKSGLIKKAHELSVLCGVDACMIITNAPNDNQNLDAVDLVWSSSCNSNDSIVVRDLINKYKEQFGRKKVYDFSKDRKRKADNMLSSLNKRNRDCSKFTMWDTKFESMDEFELRNLATDLESKINTLKIRREEMMKNKRVKSVVDDSNNGAIKLLDCNSNNNDEAIVTNQNMAMNTIQDNNDFSAMDLQPQFVCHPFDDYPLKPFDDYNSGATTEASAFSSYFLINPDMLETSLNDWNVFDFPVFDCSSMHEAYAC